MKKKLRIFDASVTQTLLWCSESWVVTQKEKRFLRTTQRTMLRRIAGATRRPDEDWIDWIKRSTRQALREANAAGIRFWVESHLQSKYAWAGHVARMQSQPDRLAYRGVCWRDSEWWAKEFLVKPANQRTRRPVCKKWLRWEDELKSFALHRKWHSWQTATRNKAAWYEAQRAFVTFTNR